MVISTVEYLSAKEATAFTPALPTVAISIRSPERPEVSLSHDLVDVLRLQFHDVLPGDFSRPEAMVFSKGHAQDIVKFISKHRRSDKQVHLLVHCESGISRSAAVAVFAASECDLPLKGKFAFLNTFVLKTLVDTAYPQNEFGV